MSAAAAQAPTPPRLTPGDYVRLRRQARGMSIEGLARATVSSPVDVAAAAAAIAGAEENRELLGEADLARLRAAIGVDPAIYAGLVDDMPAYGVCQSCGGSGGRQWVDRDETLCAACWTTHFTPGSMR